MKIRPIVLIVLMLVAIFSSSSLLAIPLDRAEDVGVTSILSPPEAVVLNFDKESFRLKNLFQGMKPTTRLVQVCHRDQALKPAVPAPGETDEIPGERCQGT